MRFCVDYNKNTNQKAGVNDALLTQVDEINIDYDPNDFTLIEFLEKYQEKQINIFFYNETAKFAEKISQIQRERPEFNIRIVLEYKSNVDYSKFGKFFFSNRVNNWEIFKCFVDLGVTDIYITEQLGFELDKVAAVAHDNNIRVRVFPNVAQRCIDRTPALKTFFIRPDDIRIYEKYIDVFDLYYWDEQKQNQSVLFDIYANDKKWFGKLNELIIGFDSDLDGKYVIPRFAEKRVKCNRECLKGGNCQMCEEIEKLSKTLEEAGITVRFNDFNKNKEEEDGKTEQVQN